MKTPRAACAAVATMALAALANAATCPPGVPTAPPFTTLMASTTDPENEAWVVETDCSHTPLIVSSVSGGLTIPQDKPIDRLASVPTATEAVVIEDARLLFSRGADFSAAKYLPNILIINFRAGLVDDLKLPSSVENLGLVTGPGNAVDKLNYPDSLLNLGLEAMGLSSLKSVPSKVLELHLKGNLFATINFPIPPKLKVLEMDQNQIPELKGITFPRTLQIFTCSSCGIKRIRGVRWSENLMTLDLTNNPIEEFEVRQSDYEILSKLEGSKNLPAQGRCADEEALVRPYFCVIPDKRFETLYGGGTDATTPSDSTGTNTNSNSTSTSADDSASSDEEGSDGNTRPGRSSGSVGGGGSKSVGGGNSSVGGSGESPVNIGPNGVRGDTNDPAMSPIVVGISIAVGSIVSGLFGVMVYRRFHTSSQHQQGLKPVDTPEFTSILDPSTSNGSSSQEYLNNDIRNDKALIPYRVDESKISLTKQIARGGFGVIFRGVYNGRAVAVKQMLPDAWRNEVQLGNFMDEIRLCASLSHPKIVEFIGVAWSSLRDISVVIEFMDGGDLGAVLHNHLHNQSLFSSTTSLRSNGAASSFTPFIPSPREWSEPWTTARINSKGLIAKDVAEAVVYLHSFSDPIIHRDLKARNVLLDQHGNAKLSDFGISREMAEDETMTSEVGTSAWIAPEVLRGDRYSERADIYSFGVLLVELDKCRHPYAGEDSIKPMAQLLRDPRDAHQSIQQQNMKIAMLVSAGELRPTPSAQCPARVRALIARCLSFAPEDRPSAIETHYELRQILSELELAL